jgi:hypothetical protein
LQLEITEIEEKKIDIVSIGNVRFGVTYLGIASIDCQPFFPQATISNPDHAETGHVVKMPRAVLFSQFLEKKNNDNNNKSKGASVYRAFTISRYCIISFINIISLISHYKHL